MENDKKTAKRKTRPRNLQIKKRAERIHTSKKVLSQINI
jgi:hypothetical protein